MIKKIAILATIILATLTFIVPAAEAKVKPGDIFWDKGNLLLTHDARFIDTTVDCPVEPRINAPVTTEALPGISDDSYSYRDETFTNEEQVQLKKSIVKCLKSEGETDGEELLDVTRNLTDSSVSSSTKYGIGSNKEVGTKELLIAMMGALGTASVVNTTYSKTVFEVTSGHLEASCEAPVTGKKASDLAGRAVSSIQCKYDYNKVLSTRLISSGITDRGEIKFSNAEATNVVNEGYNHSVMANSCEKTWITVRYNGSVQESSARCEKFGPDDGNLNFVEQLVNGVTPKGNPSKTWQENSYDKAMDKQYEKLRNEYTGKCSPPSDCGSGAYGAPGGFTQIWRSCVISTGNAETDVNNAKNCLLTFAGVRLDAEAVLEDIPRNPDEFKDVDSCGLKPAGFIVCPLVRSLAKMADGMFKMLQSILHIEPLTQSTQAGKSAYKAWLIFANIANIMFAILFLVIIFSQLTGIGLTNYGIKSLLPKIIVAAVLVNASYYICVAMIDITNILGDSLREVILAINNSLPSGLVEVSADMRTIGNEDSKTSWSYAANTILAGTVLAGGVAAVAALVFLFVPIITAVILAGITVLMVLLMRYVLVILLLIVAPIAFVSFLLPNTAKWFKRWKSTFISLLMLYPVLSLVFGLSTLAANIILNVASTRDSQALMILALAIQAIPLAISPLIVRVGGQALGNISNSIKGNGLFNRVREGAKDKQKSINTGRQLKAIQGKWTPGGSIMRKMAKNKLVRSHRAHELNRLQTDYTSAYLSGQNEDGAKVGALERIKGGLVKGYTPKTKAEKTLESMAAGGGENAKERAVAAAYSVQQNMLRDEINAAKTVLSELSPPEVVFQLQDALTTTPGVDTTAGQTAIDEQQSTTSGSENPTLYTAGENDAKALAAINTIGGMKDANSFKQMTIMSRSMNNSQRAAVVGEMGSSGIPFMQTPMAQQSVNSGRIYDEGTFNKEVVGSYFDEGYAKSSDFAKMDNDALNILKSAQQGGTLGGETSRKMSLAAQEALQNPKVTEKLSAQEINTIRSIAENR